MRFCLCVMLVVCVAGFLLTSGTVSLQAGMFTVNMDAVAHSMPVLIALAAPMIFMAVVLMITMTMGREGRRGSNRLG